MKTKVLIAVLLISMLMVDEVESWIFRIPKCRLKCRRRCRLNGRTRRYECRFSCKLKCKKGKRQAIEASEGHITPIPHYFDYYDLNDDGVICSEEFADTMGQPRTEGDLMVGFNATDTDGNGVLTENELLTSAVFEFGHDDPLFQDDQH